MADPKQHLQLFDLGPDAAPILSQMAAILEEKWECRNTKGPDLVENGDAVRQQISELQQHYEVSDTFYVIT